MEEDIVIEISLTLRREAQEPVEYTLDEVLVDRMIPRFPFIIATLIQTATSKIWRE